MYFTSRLEITCSMILGFCCLATSLLIHTGRLAQRNPDHITVYAKKQFCFREYIRLFLNTMYFTDVSIYTIYFETVAYYHNRY